MSPRPSFAEVIAPEHRTTINQGWSQLRVEPVHREDDGTWVITGYPEVRQLISDPRMGVGQAHGSPPPDQCPAGADAASDGAEQGTPELAMQGRDAPDHDWLRRHFMRGFGPPWHPTKVAELEAPVRALTSQLLDAATAHTRMDVVEDFTYPIPVAAICAVLGLPPEDHELFARFMDPFSQARTSAETILGFAESKRQMSDYLRQVMESRRADPRDDMITAVSTDTNNGRAPTDEEIVDNIFLLFVGGHETTVNTVASSILLLLRHPETLARLKADPTLTPAAFEEVLRLEPPAQFFDDRHALADTPVGDTVIPKGSRVNLVLAAANRDPRRFPDPDTFDIDRPDNQHLSFLGGPHYCFGAPMARLEGRIMVSEWVRRVENPRLVTDPPPYRHNPALRGPEHLLVDYDRIV